MSSLIKTHASELSIHNMSELETLIHEVIQEIQPTLIKNPKIIMYGKVCYQKRSLTFYSDESKGYKYSKQIAKANTLQNTKLNELLQIVNKKMGAEYNGILINHYKDGCDVIGAHSDDNDVIDNTDISTLSYGAVRNFRIRNKKNKKIVENIDTQHCSIIRMFGNFQNEFTHEIPQQKKIKNERYSFSFRIHNEKPKKKTTTKKTTEKKEMNKSVYDCLSKKLPSEIIEHINTYKDEFNKEDFTATINEISHGHCDCCMKGFNHKNEFGQCKCWCSYCGSLYADCKGKCR